MQTRPGGDPRSGPRPRVRVLRHVTWIVNDGSRRDGDGRAGIIQQNLIRILEVGISSASVVGFAPRSTARDVEVQHLHTDKFPFFTHVDSRSLNSDSNPLTHNNFFHFAERALFTLAIAFLSSIATLWSPTMFKSNGNQKSQDISSFLVCR